MLPPTLERTQMKTWLLNNCNNLDHAAIYARPNAFFDLWTHGVEARKASEMVLGDRCFVLSRGKFDRLVVDEYILGNLVESKDVWILGGQFVHGEILTRAGAEANMVYRYYFNDIGHLNQWSIRRWLSQDEIMA